MIKALIAPILALAMVGCATAKPPLPAETYSSAVNFMVASKNCFDQELLTPAMAAEAQVSFRTKLQRLDNSYSIDRNYLRNAAEQNKHMWVDEKICRELETQIHAFRLDNAQYDRNVAASTAANASQPIPVFQKPIFCNKVGAMTMCN